MSLTLNQRFQRLLVFLTNARRRAIFRRLAAFGFTKAEHAKGWGLFGQAIGMNLTADAEGEPLPVDPLGALLAALDAYENRWFPVVKATLSYEMPGLAAAVFANLGQTEGAAVLVSMSTLLDRIAAALQGPNGAALRTLLDARGFTAAVQAEIRALIERIQQADPDVLEGEDPDGDALPEGEAEALAAAWAWYGQWRTIARAAITNANLLARLGLASAKPKKPGTPAPAETPEDDDEVPGN